MTATLSALIHARKERLDAEAAQAREKHLQECERSRKDLALKFEDLMGSEVANALNAANLVDVSDPDSGMLALTFFHDGRHLRITVCPSIRRLEVNMRLAIPNVAHDPENEESQPWIDLGAIYNGEDLLALLSTLPPAR